MFFPETSCLNENASVFEHKKTALEGGAVIRLSLIVSGLGRVIRQPFPSKRNRVTSSPPQRGRDNPLPASVFAHANREGNHHHYPVGGAPTLEYLYMATVNPFHSVNEPSKPAGQRVHHNNNSCPPGRDIPQWERRQGTGGYRLCDDCARLNR